MQRNEQASCLPFDVSPLRPAFRTCCLFILAAGVLASPALMGQGNGTMAVGYKSGLALIDNQAGSLNCAQCHSAVVKSYVGDPHTQTHLTRSGKGVTCASCHGPEDGHIESGGAKSKIFNPDEATSARVDDVCLSCHQGKHRTFDRSAHGKSGLSCVSCHSVHSAGSSRYLLKVAETELCFQCHTDVKPQFSNSFHHKVEDGLIECTDCHDPHGTIGEDPFRASHRQDSLCANCHTDTAGPFVFQHAVMKTEGCTACHFPHGGPSPHLLRSSDIDAICQQCHLPAADFKTKAHIRSADDSSRTSRSCIDCHIDVHGSNSSVVFLKKE
jgi:DmsE family decaheme c-type cytochrome